MYAKNKHNTRFLTPQTSQFYNMRTLYGNTGAGGPFGTLATVNISASPGWFA